MTLLALHAIANNNGGLNAAEQPLKTGGQAGACRVQLPAAKNDAARGRRRDCVHRPTVVQIAKTFQK